MNRKAPLRRSPGKRKTRVPKPPMAVVDGRIPATGTETAGHRATGPRPATKGLASMQEEPYGYCHCGCGEKTNIAPQTISARGIVKGEPMKFVQFHNAVAAGKASGEAKRIKAGVPDGSPKNADGHSCVERKCAVCGEAFLAQWSQRLSRKACSYECAATLKRKKMQQRKGPKNPNFKSGRRVGVRDRVGEERWYAGAQMVCQAPGCPGGYPLALHHVCYEQHVRKAGGDRWDPKNSLTLCTSCHSSHHHRGRVLPLTALRDENYAFAYELLGPAAYDYFRRRYAGEDPRLDALLRNRAA